MDMSAAIGADNFTRYQHIFGFGEYTGIDLPGEAETSGLLYTADNMTEIDLATQLVRTELQRYDDADGFRVLFPDQWRLLL